MRASSFQFFPGPRYLLLACCSLVAAPSHADISTPDYGGSIIVTWGGAGDIVENSGLQCVIATEALPSGGDSGDPGGDSGTPGNGKGGGTGAPGNDKGQGGDKGGGNGGGDQDQGADKDKPGKGGGTGAPGNDKGQGAEKGNAGGDKDQGAEKGNAGGDKDQGADQDKPGKGGGTGAPGNDKGQGAEKGNAGGDKDQGADQDKPGKVKGSGGKSQGLARSSSLLGSLAEQTRPADYFVRGDIAAAAEFSLDSGEASGSLPFTLSYKSGGKPAVELDLPLELYGPFNGGSSNACNRLSRFEVYIAEGDLQGVPLGTYRATIDVTHLNDATGERASGPLDIAVTIGTRSISIIDLDDIELGNWDSVSPSLRAHETFCIRGSAGLFQVTASGEAEGFVLSNGRDRISYQVRFADGTDARDGDILVSGIPGGSYTMDTECAGDNSALYVETTTPLGNVSTGSYRGQLTLTVEPN